MEVVRRTELTTKTSAQSPAERQWDWGLVSHLHGRKRNEEVRYSNHDCSLCCPVCRCVAHGNVVEETPVPAAETAVSAKEVTVAEIEEPAALAEKEKRTIPRQEAPQEEQPEPETGPIEIPTASELQPSAGQTSTKNSMPEQTPPQVSKELQPGDKVYVAGFDWVEYEGPNLCEDGTDIYENGNKIGTMG